MFFSVIITTYGNRCLKLEKAIFSVLKQTFTGEFEIIVVDDNGKRQDIKEKNKSLIEKLTKYKAIKYYTYSENKGANYARNYGIKKANGKYIAFLDDDDYFLPNKLKKIYKEVSRGEFDLIYSNIIYRINNKKYKINKVSYSNDFQIKKEILKRNYIGETSLVVLKKEKILQIGMFDEKLKSFQDWDTWIRIIFHGGTILKINEALVECYIDRNEETRISNSFNRRIKGCHHIHTKIKKEILNNFSMKDKEEIRFFQKRELASICYENFKFSEYRKIINKIFKFKYFKTKDFIKYICSYFNIYIDKEGIKKLKLLEKR